VCWTHFCQLLPSYNRASTDLKFWLSTVTDWNMSEFDSWTYKQSFNMIYTLFVLVWTWSWWGHSDSQIRTAQTRKKTIYLSLYWVVRWWRPAWPWWWWWWWWRSSPEAVVRHPSRLQPPEARWWFGCLGTPVLIAFTLNTHTHTHARRKIYQKTFTSRFFAKKNTKNVLKYLV